MERFNICFLRIIYRTPGTSTELIGELPKGFKGFESGPQLRGLVLLLSVAMRATQCKIQTLLRLFHIEVSEGLISNYWIKNLTPFVNERNEVFKAGLESSHFHNVDHTGARHNGLNYQTLVVSAPLYTMYFTSETKCRLRVLAHLMGGRLRHRFDGEALDLLKANEIPAKWLLFMNGFHDQDFACTEDLRCAIIDKFGKLPSSRTWELIQLYTGLSAYSSQTDYAVVKHLVCDEGKEFLLLAFLCHCWIHLGRKFEKLSPVTSLMKEVHTTFLNDFHDLYRRLKKYQSHPTQDQRQSLTTRFDEVFSPRQWDRLDALISRVIEKKESYLRVLEYPELPIHNNHAEQQLREHAILRNIRNGTRTTEGLLASDVHYSLYRTCGKLNISYWEYLQDRLTDGGRIPPLAEVIRKKGRWRGG